MHRFQLLLLLVLGSLVACGDGSPDGAVRIDVTESHPSAEPLSPATECVVTTWREAAGPRDHREPCSFIDYPSLPPTTGPHYSVWADFQSYAEPVPWGYVVHALEHGAIFFGYDCPDGCPEVLDAIAEVITAHGDDPACVAHATANARFIVAPVRGLEGSVVALAWEHAYVATCLDPASLMDFAEIHYGMAPEDLCAEGFAETGDWCAG